MIRLNSITLTDCQALCNGNKAVYDTIKTVDFSACIYDSRRHLDQVYWMHAGLFFSNRSLPENSQIPGDAATLAGRTVAGSGAEQVFYSTAVAVDFVGLTARQKHGIDAKDAMKNIGKQVTICEHVYTVQGIGCDYADKPRRQIPEPIDNGGDIW